jgi:hypothetical protein
MPSHQENNQPIREGARFLHEQDGNLHLSDEVQRAVDRASTRKGIDVNMSDPNQKISSYLDRIERLSSKILPALVEVNTTKEEDIKDSYWQTQARVMRERGEGNFDIGPGLQHHMYEVMRADQKASLKKWVDYFRDNENLYPAWFKVYAMRGVSKMAPFDANKGKYPKRDKSTTAPFPEIDEEAIASAYHSLTDESGNPLSGKQKPGFAKLYSEASKELRDIRSERKTGVDNGAWKRYEKGSDFSVELSESLQGHGTGWCTAFPETASKQLSGGDFYVFYSEDENGDATIPRIAIKMFRGVVDEVRGIEPGQELEPDMLETAAVKVAELPGGDKYQQKVDDMRRVTSIEKAVHEGRDVANDDLRFLYELDRSIVGFGSSKDPRIMEIIKGRDTIADLTNLLELQEGELVDDITNISEATKWVLERWRIYDSVSDALVEVKRDEKGILVGDSRILRQGLDLDEGFLDSCIVTGVLMDNDIISTDLGSLKPASTHLESGVFMCRGNDINRITSDGYGVANTFESVRRNPDTKYFSKPNLPTQALLVGEVQSKNEVLIEDDEIELGALSTKKDLVLNGDTLKAHAGDVLVLKSGGEAAIRAGRLKSDLDVESGEDLQMSVTSVDEPRRLKLTVQGDAYLRINGNTSIAEGSDFNGDLMIDAGARSFELPEGINIKGELVIEAGTITSLRNVYVEGGIFFNGTSLEDAFNSTGLSPYSVHGLSFMSEDGERINA